MLTRLVRQWRHRRKLPAPANADHHNSHTLVVGGQLLRIDSMFGPTHHTIAVHNGDGRTIAHRTIRFS